MTSSLASQSGALTSCSKKPKNVWVNGDRRHERDPGATAMLLKRYLKNAAHKREREYSRAIGDTRHYLYRHTPRVQSHPASRR